MAKRSNDIPIKLEKIRPKPGQLRRYSTSNSMIRLSEPAMNTPMKPEKTKPKPGPARRYSTGNSLIQTSEPIYLRSSSISSCHDFCKYGKKHDSKTNLKPPRITTKRNDQNAVKEEKLSLPDKNYRGKKADSDSAKPKPKPKSKPSAANHESSHQLTSAKQPKKPFLISLNIIRINQNDERKDKVGRQTRSFLPNSIKAPTAKSSPKKVSDSKIKNCVKKPEIDKTSINVENEKVPSEKIIHVIEPTQDDENPQECTEEENSVEIENGDNNDGDHHMVKDSVAGEDITDNDGEEVEIENGDDNGDHHMVKDSVSDEDITNHNENDEEVVAIENGDNNGDPTVKDSVSDEDITNHNENGGEVVEIEIGDNNVDPMVKDSVSKEGIEIHDKNDDPCEIVLQHQAEERKSLSVIEEAKRKLIEIRKNKVMDLVAAFEKLIKNPESESITPVTTS